MILPGGAVSKTLRLSLRGGRRTRLTGIQVHYFLERARGWAEPPIMYPYLTRDLQDADFVRDRVVPPLLSLLEMQKLGDAKAQEAARVRRRRAIASLQALVSYPRSFRVHPETREKVKAALAAVEAEAGSNRGELDSRAATMPALLEQMQAPVPHGVVRLPLPGGAGVRWASYVHDEGRLRVGKVRETAAEARADRARLVGLSKEGAGSVDEQLRAWNGDQDSG